MPASCVHNSHRVKWHPSKTDPQRWLIPDGVTEASHKSTTWLLPSEEIKDKWPGDEGQLSQLKSHTPCPGFRCEPVFRPEALVLQKRLEFPASLLGGFLHDCMQWSKSIELYTWKGCILLYIKYIIMKLCSLPH